MRYGGMIWRVVALAVAAGVAASAAWAAQPAANDRPARGPQARPEARPGSSVTLTVGQAAPELELAPLTFTTDANGQQVGTIGKEKIKLSTYKGKAPIVIFSSSYT